MLLAISAVVLGLIVLVWSADRLVDGAAASAGQLGMPPMLIGIIILGFGTSAPEIVVSIISALKGNPGLALGNAYGSNIANIALILGITALLSPIIVHSRVVRNEMPVLIGVTALAAWQIRDGMLTTAESWTLIVVFLLYMAWIIRQGLRQQADALGVAMTAALPSHAMPVSRAVLWIVIGLVLLIASSQLLIWGAISIAAALGVSDLVIGLTIVAIGTSLPELASSIAAVRKGEHDIALGNVVGSNLFNTLIVVGIAGVIRPIAVEPQIFTRDMLTIGILTVLLFVFAYGVRGRGKINRPEGAFLLVCYFAYIGYLLVTTVFTSAH